MVWHPETSGWRQEEPKMCGITGWVDVNEWLTEYRVSLV
jgi:hypothetical protein